MNIGDLIPIGGAGTAKPSDVRAGKTYSSDEGVELPGGLPTRATEDQTITPGTSNQVLQAGIYDGDITIKGDVNLLESNIKQGVSIFGKLGTLVPLTNEKKYATGVVNGSDQQTQTISGIGFTPSFVLWYRWDYQTYIWEAAIYMNGTKHLSQSNIEDITVNGQSFTVTISSGMHFVASSSYRWVAVE